MAVLEELEVTFDLYEVDYDGGETQSPEYRLIQPLGLIPALVLDNGKSMFESAAIIIYLCDRHRDVELSPSLNDVQRPYYLQWMLFLADTLYSSYNRLYHPEYYTTSKQDEEHIKEKARERMLSQWQIVEDALADNGPWLLGKQFSACDIYLQMITTWHEDHERLFTLFPNIKMLAKSVMERDSCSRAFSRHHFESGV